MPRMRVLILVVVFSATWFVRGEEPPFRGIVVDPVGKPFSLRLAPPTASSSGYSLGTFACAVFSGTTVYVTDRRQIANGEVWYFVQVERPTGTPTLRPTECLSKTTGWVIGQLKDGRPTIAPQQDNVAPPAGTGFVPPRRTTPLAFQREEEHGFTTLYLMLGLGTVIGVAIVGWERHGSIAISPLFSPLALFEMLVLVIANVILMTTVVPHYFAIDSSSVNAKVFRICLPLKQL